MRKQSILILWLTLVFGCATRPPEISYLLFDTTNRSSDSSLPWSALTSTYGFDENTFGPEPHLKTHENLFSFMGNISLVDKKHIILNIFGGLPNAALGVGLTFSDRRLFAINSYCQMAAYGESAVENGKGKGVLLPGIQAKLKLFHYTQFGVGFEKAVYGPGWTETFFSDDQRYEYYETNAAWFSLGFGDIKGKSRTRWFPIGEGGFVDFRFRHPTKPTLPRSFHIAYTRTFWSSNEGEQNPTSQ